MLLDTVKAEVNGLLATNDLDIRDAQQALHEADGDTRVRAAGRLERLQRRRTDIEAFARELDDCKGGPVEAVMECVRENVLLVKLAMEDWVRPA